MNPLLHAVRLGFRRGWLEFRHSLRNPQEFGFNIFFAIVTVIVIATQRDETLEGVTISVAMMTLPSVVGLMLGLGGIMGAAGLLSVEREDGTLLRAKAIPNGMVGYLVSRVVVVATTTLVSLVIIFVPSLFLVPELISAPLSQWLTLLWIIPLGLLSTLPWGAVFGAIAKSPAALFGIIMLPIIVLTGISGIFYPISALPEWVQWIAQIFPIYWLGLGVRSALLPEAAALAEIGESWRTLQTIGVLGLWTLVGFAIIPGILRRMARKESGSAVADRRQRAMQRGA